MGITFKITVTAADRASLFHITAPQRDAQKNASICPEGDNPLLYALYRALVAIKPLRFCTLGLGRKGKNGKVRVIISTDSQELISAGAYLSQIEDLEGLPEEAVKVATLMQNFDMCFLRLGPEDVADLKKWAAGLGN